MGHYGSSRFPSRIGGHRGSTAAAAVPSSHLLVREVLAPYISERAPVLLALYDCSHGASTSLTGMHFCLQRPVAGRDPSNFLLQVLLQWRVCAASMRALYGCGIGRGCGSGRGFNWRPPIRSAVVVQKALRWADWAMRGDDLEWRE